MQNLVLSLRFLIIFTFQSFLCLFSYWLKAYLRIQQYPHLSPLLNRAQVFFFIISFPSIQRYYHSVQLIQKQTNI